MRWRKQMRINDFEHLILKIWNYNQIIERIIKSETEKYIDGLTKIDILPL